MKIFRDFTMHWWQYSIFKITLVAFGIAIGSQWSEWLGQYQTLWIAIFVFGSIYLVWLWFSKD